MSVYCCEQELLAAPQGHCPGGWGVSDGRRDGSSISACFKVLVKNSSPTACGRLRVHPGVVMLAKSGNQTTKPTAPNHHQHTTGVLAGSPIKTSSDFSKYPKSNSGCPRLCLYGGTGWYCFWKLHYSTRATPEEHLGRQPFKDEFLHKVCFYSGTECTCRERSFWCCWTALQQLMPL